MTRTTRAADKDRPNTPVRALAEALEPRRLLTVTLDADTGLLAIATGAGDDVVQFEAIGDSSGATGVRVTTAEGFAVPVVSEIFSLDSVRHIRVTTGDGNDLVIGGDRLFVPMLIAGGNGNDSLSGGNHNDTLRGGVGDDYLFGNGGGDLLDGEAGADLMLGGVGFDTVTYANRINGLNITLDNAANDGETGEGDNVGQDIESVLGGIDDDEITANADATGLVGVAFHGGEGNDTLIGSLGDDTLDGDAGNDTLDGDAGNDTLDGRDGADLLIARDDQADIVRADDGTPDVDIIVRDLSDTGAEVDDVTDDQPDFQVAKSLLRADPGEPTGLATGASLDATGQLTILGTEGGDRIFVFITDENRLYVEVAPLGSAPQRETFLALEDVTAVNVQSLGGNDFISGEVATIPLYLDGGDGDDTLIGGISNDVLAGGLGDDLLYGDDGDDILDGSFGRDLLDGGFGNDTVTYANRTVDIAAYVGAGPASGEFGESDTIEFDVEAVIGGSGDDFLTTAGTATRFFGGAGNDTLTGGGADDFFDGGAGLDLLSGNGGDDTFFSRDDAIDSLFGGSGNDNALADADDVLADIESIDD